MAIEFCGFEDQVILLTVNFVFQLKKIGKKAIYMSLTTKIFWYVKNENKTSKVLQMFYWMMLYLSAKIKGFSVDFRQIGRCKSQYWKCKVLLKKVSWVKAKLTGVHWVQCSRWPLLARAKVNCLISFNISGRQQAHFFPPAHAGVSWYYADRLAKQKKTEFGWSWLKALLLAVAKHFCC